MIRNSRKAKNVFIFLMIFLFQNLVYAANPKKDVFDYGLSFFSHSVNQDERTSLELTPDRPLKFTSNSFEISFDLKLKEELYTYGYVARIIANDVASFDIVSYLLKGKLNFVLTNKDKIIENISIEDSLKIIKDKWTTIRLQFNKNEIRVKVGETEFKMNHSFNDFQNIKIYFGRNKHPNFYTTDVPPMTIRNILIKKNNGEVFRKWELMGHNRNEVFDVVNNDRATVENGIWEIDKHTKWTRIKSFTTANKNPQVTFDDTSGRIFVAYDNRVFIYNARSNTMDTINVVSGNPYIGVSSQIIYVPQLNELISYNPDLQKLNRYNSSQRKWEDNYKVLIENKQHHNRAIDKENNQLILFGGYGEHKYSSQLCKIKLDSSQKWIVTSLDSVIYPRYLSAMGWEDKDNLLIIGGHGSPSGKQEESPRNFYDLYRINVRNGKCTKVWSMDSPKSHFVFGNSLVVDKEENRIYSLTYNNSQFNTHIYLSQFDLNTQKPTQYIMSDSIEYNFLDIRSFCDLFFDKETSSLYAIVQQEAGSETASIDIYKLIFPPFSQDKVALSNTDRGTRSRIKYGIIIFVVILVLTFVIGTVIRRRRRQNSAIQSVNTVETRTLHPIRNPQPKPSSMISFLGGLQVFDKEGNDMTSDFTPTIKLLFLYIFLSSIKNGKGITSQRLDDTFWFDMEKSKASNNRNVNIRKLRLILEKIGHINLSNRGSYWVLDIEKDVICDYKEVTDILLRLKSRKENINKDNITQIIGFASAGALLPNVDAEWIDEYKAEYSTLITEIMLQAIHIPEIKEDNRLLLKIADVILISDAIDEDAVRIKCRVLFQTGQKGLSKQCFDKFYIEYKRLLNATPDLKYEEIIS